MPEAGLERRFPEDHLQIGCLGEELVHRFAAAAVRAGLGLHDFEVAPANAPLGGRLSGMRNSRTECNAEAQSECRAKSTNAP